jgi:hypothetical protein
MSTYPSKQQKSESMTDQILIFVYIMIVGILMVSGFNNNRQYDYLSRALGSQNHLYLDTSASANVSFASDEGYWNANCSHGWAKDSTCDGIVLRAQSCEVGMASTYCSNYEDYLQQFHVK